MREFLGKRVTVMGLGLHGGGLAVARWMYRHGACVTVTDLKSARELREPVHALRRMAREHGSGTLVFVLGQHRVRDFRDADLVMQNPGVPRESKYLAIARAARVPIENEASLFFKTIHAQCRAQNNQTIRIIGVTGTRGKSTTVALIHAMLKVAGQRAFIAGNIRIPMFDVLDRVVAAARRGPVDVVLELSSWHCEALSAATGGPDVAVLTNLYPDHLNRYPSMRSYASAKARIVRFQDRQGVVVANAEQSVTRAMAALTPGTVVRFARHAPRRPWTGFTIRDGECVRVRRGRAAAIAPRALLRLPGAHNTMNLLAATAAATACGVRPLEIRRALRAFTGLPGRLETIARINTVTYINDTCATSPDGAIAAFETLRSHAERGTRNAKRSIVLITGGVDKNLVFDQWAQEVMRNVTAIVFLPGTATEKMKTELRKFQISNFKFSMRDASSMHAAVRRAAALARPGDIVLLSPGAASFGLFRHEFDRGDQFVKAVRSL